MAKVFGRDCVMYEKNLKRCPATEDETPYRGVCCLCIRHFKNQKSLPPCAKRLLK